MRKLIIFLVTGMFWCNVGLANILLVDCKKTYQAGFESINGKVLKEDKVYELEEGEKKEYYVSFKDGHVYYSKVIDDFSLGTLELTIKKLKKEGIDFGTGGLSKVSSTLYIINFFDEEEVIATHVENPNTAKELFEEIIINLKTNRVKKRWYGKTELGQYAADFRANMYKDLGGYPVIETCEEKETSSSSEGSSGTAFFINNKGNLLTNHHVVAKCKQLKINYFDKEYEAQLIAKDKTLDLALLKVEAQPKSYLNFSNNILKKRQPITIAGYPLGKGLSDDLKINDGKISSLKGFENNTNEVTVDIAINPGNSGGPIVDESGNLVAVAVSGMSKEVTEGINFGIKSWAAANFLSVNDIQPNMSNKYSKMNDDKLNQLLEESTLFISCTY